MSEEYNEGVVENEMPEMEVTDESRYFSESGLDIVDSVPEEPDLSGDEPEEAKQEENTENSEPTQPDEKTYTQTDIDKMIQKRLDRERRTFETKQLELEKQSVDKYIAEQGHVDMRGKPITTQAEYNNAIKLQDMYNNLINNEGFTEAQAKRIAMAENKATNVEQRLNELMNKEKETQAIVDVMNWHDEMVDKGILNDSFDYAKIPDEVLNSGAPLKESYMNHVIKNIRVSTEQQTLKNITSNKVASTGSTQDNTVGNESEFTHEYIEKMASSVNGSQWVKANYDSIVKAGYFK